MEDYGFEYSDDEDEDEDLDADIENASTTTPRACWRAGAPRRRSTDSRL